VVNEHCCPGNARACLDGVIIEVASSSEPVGGEALPREHVRGLEGWQDTLMAQTRESAWHVSLYPKFEMATGVEHGLSGVGV
jgi:hypothetical protein